MRANSTWHCCVIASWCVHCEESVGAQSMFGFSNCFRVCAGSVEAICHMKKKKKSAAPSKWHLGYEWTENLSVCPYSILFFWHWHTHRERERALGRDFYCACEGNEFEPIMLTGLRLCPLPSVKRFTGESVCWGRLMNKIWLHFTCRFSLKQAAGCTKTGATNYFR